MVKCRLKKAEVVFRRSLGNQDRRVEVYLEPLEVEIEKTEGSQELRQRVLWYLARHKDAIERQVPVIDEHSGMRVVLQLRGDDERREYVIYWNPWYEIKHLRI